MSEIGSNSVNAGQLRAFIERAERLHEERQAIADDISEVFKEAKSEGYDVAIIKKVMGLRRMDPQKRREMEELLAVYCSALGEA
jgi:uncharacterized protein (UPF0335 family)